MAFGFGGRTVSLKFRVKAADCCGVPLLSLRCSVLLWYNWRLALSGAHIRQTAQIVSCTLNIIFNMSYHQRRRFIPPEVGSIHRAIVTRIESYGCFVKLLSANTDNDESSPTTISGLVHISQLTSITNNGARITNVNDVVSINDEVYVKVMEVTMEQPTEDNGRQRHKFKLSMKYVHQDTGQDLDPDGELMEQDLMRSQHRSNGGGGGRTNSSNNNFEQDGTGGANSLLGRSLASNIGMSSAIDPGSLILKGKGGSAGGGGGDTKFNGYLLVGEDEGEAPTASSVRHESTTAAAAPPAAAVRPMGRGRATTLPAWMTRQNDDDDRLGSMKNEKGPGDDDDNSRGDRHRKKSSRRRDNKHHHRHRDRKRSSSRKHSRKHKKSSRHRSRSRGRSSHSESYDDSSSSDAYSRSRSRSPSHKKKRKKSKHNRRRHHRHRGDRDHDYNNQSRSSRSRSSDNSRDYYDRQKRRGSSVSSPPSAFNNVEEARAIMERLERRQREG